MREQHFYNTISLSGDELKQADAQALSLENLIAAIFKAHPGLKRSPSQVHIFLQTKYAVMGPLTSVRRAMTNLSNKKFGEVLEKMGKEDQIPGIWGKPENVWVLKGSLEKIYHPGQKSAADYAKNILAQGKLL